MIGFHIISLLSAIQACCAIYYYFFGYDHFVSGTLLRAGGTYRDPSTLCPILVVSVPLIFTLRFAGANKLEKLIWSIALVLTFTALILTWYRGAIFLISVSLVWLAYRQYRNFFLVSIFATALACFIILVFGMRNTEGPNHLSSERSMNGRIQLWHEAWTFFVRHPLVGNRLVNVQFIARTRFDGTIVAYSYPHPHNLMLYWLDEMGVFGAFLSIGLIVGIYKILGRKQSTIGSGVAAVWIAVWMLCFFETPFGVCQSSFQSTNAILSALLGFTILLPDDTSVVTVIRKKQCIPTIT